MIGFLNTAKKEECFGCEACVQVCTKGAIQMKDDELGFRYPNVNMDLCIHCGLCNKVCPAENKGHGFDEKQVAFGGYIKDGKIKEQSTSGGAFSAIVDAWCDENYVIFGAIANGLKVRHVYTMDKNDLAKFRRSKYSQSIIGTCYQDAKCFLNEGKKVLFSGTPCQIAGLKNYLRKNYEKLLTIEVVCEGVPSPLYVRKLDSYLNKKYNSQIKSIDYRFKDRKKWDFEVMKIDLQNGKSIKKDRWLNPFWSIWLSHLMTRPSCYQCPFATNTRGADITLGDLWGVHLYCPELYGKNGGASLIICNTQKGERALDQARKFLYGHFLNFSDALKYQSPMRKHIDDNSNRALFEEDLKFLDYKTLCQKWARKPTLKLLWSKYIWGNRQKMFLWNLFHKDRT